MYHAMAHGMNVGNASNLVDSRFFRDGPTENHLHGGTRVSDGLGETFWRFTVRRKRDDPGAADTLDQPVGQTLVRVLFDSLEISRNQLKLDRRTAAIKDQYVHPVNPVILSNQATSSHEFQACPRRARRCIV